MREDANVGAFQQAWSHSYGWKSPIEKTKLNQTSIALYLIAGFMFVSRLLWVLQLVKLLVRWRKKTKHIHPMVNEIYFMGSVVAEAGICICVAAHITPIHLSTTLIALVCIWKIYEVVTHNMYYVLLRPVLEENPPQNLFRSLVLAGFGCIETWLLLSLLWFYCGATVPPIGSIRDALYFSASTFFTVGYGDIHATGTGEDLAIFSMIVASAMLLVILSRAMTLQKPLPQQGEPAEEVRKTV